MKTANQTTLVKAMVKLNKQLIISLISIKCHKIGLLISDEVRKNITDLLRISVTGKEQEAELINISNHLFITVNR